MKRSRLPNKENDVITCNGLLWVPVGEGYSLTDDNGAEIVITRSGSGYKATLYYAKEPAPLVIKPVPLKECLKVSSEYARRYLKIKSVDTETDFFNSAARATDEQVLFLKAHRINRNMSRVDAAIEIMKIKALRRVSSRNLAHANCARLTSGHQVEKHPAAI